MQRNYSNTGLTPKGCLGQVVLFIFGDQLIYFLVGAYIEGVRRNTNMWLDKQE